MNFTSARFVPARRMGMYEPYEPIHHQSAMWGDFKCSDESPPLILESEDTSHGTFGHSDKYDEEANKRDKVLRRLAQNREAARRSRLRKKAYVKELESSKLRLIQLEQELQLVRQQGLYVGGDLDNHRLGYAGNINPAIATFEMEYGQWVEEQNRQISDLWNALKSNIGDMELRLLVDGGMRHYLNLFVMKSTATKADVFYVLSGMWRTPAERFFLWIGGFRPSEILKVLVPHLEPLSEQQHVDVCHLSISCKQAEDALSQGMEKLRMVIAETVASRTLGEHGYVPHVRSATDNLEALVRFVGQADHLRQETLQQLLRILTARQAARALLAFGEHFKRLRSLSSVWSTRPRESI